MKSDVSFVNPRGLYKFIVVPSIIHNVYEIDCSRFSYY